MKTIVVTGATDGIGLAVVKALLAADCRVIGLARNPAKAAAVAAAIGSPQLTFVPCDLASVAAVDAAATRIEALLEAEHDGLEALVHVAGTVQTHRTLTVDGYETTFAVNHLAVHQLTHRLLPMLERRPGARVIVITSRAHRWGFVHFHDVMWKCGYWLLTAYAQSKLMNVLFVRDMARRFAPESISFYAIDPGLVNTGIVAKTTAGIERWIWSWRRKDGVAATVPAAGIARIATSPTYAMRSGLLWRDGVAVKASKRSGNVRVMDRLHDLSDGLLDAARKRASGTLPRP